MAKAERSRLLVLLGLLVALLVWAGVHYSGARSDGSGGPSARAVAYQGRKVPRLALELLTPVPETAGEGERNPFAFGAPPTPTPAPTLPPPSPRPTLPPRPTATPRWVDGPDGRLPPPPPFDRSFIGAFGPEHTVVAVFRKGENVDVAIRGGCSTTPTSCARSATSR